MTRRIQIHPWKTWISLKDHESVTLFVTRCKYFLHFPTYSPAGQSSNPLSLLFLLIYFSFQHHSVTENPGINTAYKICHIFLGGHFSATQFIVQYLSDQTGYRYFFRQLFLFQQLPAQ